jgi:hypothetical protein
MSSTIGAKKASFMVFGSGYDYTLADSGDGEEMFFCHRSVPLGSVNHAGQYYFMVPDLYGEPMDAVLGDIAHVTFDPAIGTTFDTLGEVTVKAHYYREYDLPYETIVVEKEIEQTIEVVDHGNIVTQATSDSMCDIYSDGYCFWHPYDVNIAYNGLVLQMPNSNDHPEILKTSNIPWRVQSLGNMNWSRPFLYASNLTDISELVDAKVDSVLYMNQLFYGCSSLADISALSTWAAKPRRLNEAFSGCISITSLEPLTNWNGSELKLAEYAFSAVRATSLKGLENWNVSELTDALGMFASMVNLTDVSALANWDMEYVTNMSRMFKNTGAIDISPLGDWNTGKVTNMSEMFAESGIVGANGNHWDTSKVTNVQRMFYKSGAFTTDDMDWDLSSVTNANEMFRESKIKSFANMAFELVNADMSYFAYGSDLETLAGMSAWSAKPSNLQYAFSMMSKFSNTSLAGVSGIDVSGLTSLKRCFYGSAGHLTHLTGLESWDVSSVTDFEDFIDLHWAYDLSAIANWTFGAVTKATRMLGVLGNTGDLSDLAGWNVSSWTSGAFYHMMGGGEFYISPKLGNKKVFQTTRVISGFTYTVYEDFEGDDYTPAETYDVDNPLIQVTTDCSDVENWNVPSTGLSAITGNTYFWLNLPSWN